MRKRVRLLLSLLWILLFLAGYVLVSNWNYLVNRQDNGVEISADQLELVNWEIDDLVIHSMEDSQIIIRGINGYVKDIAFNCKRVDGIELSPVVYYKGLLNLSFSDDRSQTANYFLEDGRLTVLVDRWVSEIRLDLLPGEGLTMDTVQTIMRYPAGIRIDLLGIGISLFAACFFLLPFYFKKSEWGKLDLYLEAFGKYRYLLMNLVKKDLTTKYRRSVLGILWSILNPLLMMMVITAVFQKLFRFEIENFPLYYLTGSLIFNFVSEATSGAMNSILLGGALIRKVYIPKYIFPLEKCLFALVNMLFSMVAVIIMFLVLRFRPPWTIILSVIPMFYALVFCIGFGLILSTMSVYFRDTIHLYSVWLTAWTYLTPIIYPENILPRAVRSIVSLNPLYYYVGYFRDVAMYGVIPDLRTNLICLLFSFGFLVIGLLVFKRNQDRFILYI